MTAASPRGQYPTQRPDWATIARWDDDGRPALNPDGTPATPCEYVKPACGRGAIGLSHNPTLGTVPTCRRCAAQQGVPLQIFPVGSAPIY